MSGCRFGHLNRPLSAFSQVCSQHIPEIASLAVAAGLVDSVLHELLHALFFTPAHLRSALSPDELPVADNIAAVRSQSVLREARAQFDCDSLSEVQLEWDIGSEDRGGHWGSIALEDDIMSRTFFRAAMRRRVLSRVTLALAEDTGWFSVDWAASGFLRRGFHAGCGQQFQVRT